MRFQLTRFDGSDKHVEIEGKLHAALKQHVLPGLDAMRALAISMVLLFHESWYVSGAIGVMLFFVLSGFLITSSLIREFGRTGSISFREFYRKRSFRIFPNFYAAWLLTLVTSLVVHHAVVWKQAWLTFFYLSNYGRALTPSQFQHNYFMTVSWSLAIEEQFYLLWPLGLLWLLRRPRYGLTILVSAILAISAWRIVATQMLHVPWSYISNAFETRVDAMLIGSSLAMLLQHERIPRFATLVLQRRWYVLLPLLSLAALNWAEYRPMSDWFTLAGYFLQPFLAAVLLLQWAYWGMKWRWMRTAPIRWMAHLSYSIYLFHAWIMLYVQAGLPLRTGHRLAGLLVVPLMALIPYFLIERPFMRLRDRRTPDARRDAVIVRNASFDPLP